MTESITIYRPASLTDPALLAEAKRLGCKPEDVGFVHECRAEAAPGFYIQGLESETSPGGFQAVVPFVIHDSSIHGWMLGLHVSGTSAVRIYRSSDGQMFVESGEVRVPAYDEWFIEHGYRPILDSVSNRYRDNHEVPERRILIPARWADEGEHNED